MYYQPYSQKKYNNRVAIAITEANAGNSLGASNMWYNSYDYMKKKDFYRDLSPLLICRLGVCIKAEMGKEYKTKLEIKGYPISYDDASNSLKSKVNAPAWNQFLQQQFGIELVGSSLKGAITPGASLKGKSVSQLMDKSYAIAAAGSIENYSKYTMTLQKKENKYGDINVPFVNVGPGKVEGFAT